MGRIAVDGAELAVDEEGTGTPLVLVHGTGAQASSWGRSVADLAAGGYRVLAYDRRGYGRSTHRPVRDYRVHVADLAAVLEHVPTSRLADRPFPITWLLGAESRDWYGRLHARVEQAVPGIRTEHIPGVGHLAHLEAPEVFAAAVLRVLTVARP